MLLQNAFHAGDYGTVIGADLSSSSPETQTAARVLRLRSLIAAGKAQQAQTELQKIVDDPEQPEILALKALADDSVAAIEALATDHGDNATVQVIGGTLLHAAGRTDEALALLAKHEGNLEACVGR